MTASFPSKLLIIGATGSIGKFITSAVLSANPPVAKEVSILISPETESSPDHRPFLCRWKSQGLKIITGDLTSTAELSEAYDEIDTVISCLGQGNILSQVGLMRLAEESKSVRWFLHTEYGSDIDGGRPPSQSDDKVDRAQVARYIRENIRNVKCTYLATGPIIDMFLPLLPVLELAGGHDVKSKRAVVTGNLDDEISFTSMRGIGKAMVAALRHADSSMDNLLRIRSFVATPNAIIQEFEKQTSSKWTIENKEIEELRELEEGMLEKSSPLVTFCSVRRKWAECGSQAIGQSDMASLGIREEDMESLSSVVHQAIKQAK
ncbi:NAD(P)-binding protein [Xylariomycetidae sp. FL2044]|nr:NAD(P)-binding protein [Xylariomycetidae sp. FL2044]